MRGKTMARRSRRRFAGAAIALLASSSSSSTSPSSSSSVVVGATRIDRAPSSPHGLLFSSEMTNDHDAATNDDDEGASGRRRRTGGIGGRGTDGSTMGGIATTRVHPIRRIYGGDGAHVRRKMEELENEMPYFRTGVRGDPNHRLLYLNHPFDEMRIARERSSTMKTMHDADDNGGGWDLDSRNLQEADGEEEGGGQDVDDGGDVVDDNPFRPIRIHLETAALDAKRTSSNGPQIDFVKNSILPRMRDYWTEALSVVPVEGNLLISSADLQGRLYCGDTEFSEVPATHMSEGVPNADLVLYVSGVPSARFCGPSTLAVAVACNFDQVSRARKGSMDGVGGIY